MQKEVDKWVDLIINSCSDNHHLSLVINNFEDKKELENLKILLEGLRLRKRNFVSVLVGGYYVHLKYNYIFTFYYI